MYGLKVTNANRFLNTHNAFFGGIIAFQVALRSRACLYEKASKTISTYAFGDGQTKFLRNWTSLNGIWTKG